MPVLVLAYPASAAQDLLRHPALKARGRRPKPQPLEMHWHDTADLQLAQRDAALCESGGDWRLEGLGLGWPHRPGTIAPPRATAINPAGLEEQIGEALPGPLRPVSRFTGTVLCLPLALGAEGIACRVVSGTLTTLGLTGETGASHAVHRLEIEAPAALALDLARSLAADLPVQPAVTTLPQEALLLRGAKIKPPPGPTLIAEMPTETALAIIASGFVSTFLTRLAQIPSRQGPEAVHQARVTMRRLRALMLAFRPILEDSEERVKALLVELKAVLGPARDWDVFLAETVAPIAGALPETEAAILWLRQAAETRRETAYAALIAYQHQADYRALLWELVGLCLGVGWRPLTPPAESMAAPAAPALSTPLAAAPRAAADLTRLGDFARRCLERRWKRTARPVRELIAMPIPELHAMRIKCKKLRYQAEMFQDALPGKAMRKLIRRLTETQELMGALNDGAVAGELAESLRPRGRAAAQAQLLAAEATGLVRGYGLGRVKGSRAAVLDSWQTLVKADPF